MKNDTQLQNESKQSIIKKFALGVGAFFLCASALVGLGAIALSSHQSNVVKTSALDINEYDGNIYFDENSVDKNIYLGYDFSSNMDYVAESYFMIHGQDNEYAYDGIDGDNNPIFSGDDGEIIFNLDSFIIQSEDIDFSSFDYWHFPQLAQYLNSAKTTLSPSELNNNHYTHLGNYFNTLSEVAPSNYYLVYDNNYYYFDELLIGDTLSFISDCDDSTIFFELDYERYIFRYSSSGSYSSFTDNLYIYSFEIKENIYAPNNPTGLLETLVALLTGGITGLAGGIGTGVSGLVSSIFVTDGHLSVFASAIIIFAGVSLAIGLSRFIMNFLTSLGAKK